MMKLMLPIIGGGLALWYTREVMPKEVLAGVPLGEQYPEVVNLLAAVIVFVVLAMLVKKKKTSTP